MRVNVPSLSCGRPDCNGRQPEKAALSRALPTRRDGNMEARDSSPTRLDPRVENMQGVPLSKATVGLSTPRTDGLGYFDSELAYEAQGHVLSS